jgi:2'-5' RNA ligase
MGTDKLRLFIAVDVPLGLRRALSETLDRKAYGPGRWTDVESQHVTLKFLGWSERLALGKIGDAARVTASEAAPFQARLSTLGAFPSSRRAAVLWVGVEDDGACAALAGALDRRMTRLGFTAEARDFTPHLTLARFKPPRALGELSPLALETSSFEVDEVVLYRSHLSSEGARYEAIDRYPLAGRVAG